MSRFFDPWEGKNYKRESGLLILSESAYCWPSTENPEEVECPQADHPTENTVKCWSLDEENWNKPGKNKGVYARKITRMLCDNKNPSFQERLTAWEEVAYSIYVQTPMKDQHARPTDLEMENSSQAFLALLEELRPARVLVTGITAWEAMPHTQLQSIKYLEAYRLKDGHISWCKAIRHPRVNSWENMAREINEFKLMNLESLRYK